MEGLKRIPVEDADVSQIAEFVEVYLNIELSAVERSSRSKLMAKLKAAGEIPTAVIVPDIPQAMDVEDATEALGEWNPEKERWVVFRIQPGTIGNADTPVPVAVNDDTAVFNRGVTIVARERMYRTLVASRETRREQGTADDGQPKRFADCTVVQVDCYPSSFFGTRGFVKDGPPKGLPADYRLIAQA